MVRRANLAQSRGGGGVAARGSGLSRFSSKNCAHGSSRAQNTARARSRFPGLFVRRTRSESRSLALGQRNLWRGEARRSGRIAHARATRRRGGDLGHSRCATGRFAPGIWRLICSSGSRAGFERVDSSDDSGAIAVEPRERGALRARGAGDGRAAATPRAAFRHSNACCERPRREPATRSGEELALSSTIFGQRIRCIFQRLWLCFNLSGNSNASRPIVAGRSRLLQQR